LLVVRATCGGGYGDAGQHEQALWGLLGSVPGLAVVVPSTPADAAGLLLSALAHEGPVVYLEHKLLSEEWLDLLGGAAATAYASLCRRLVRRGGWLTPDPKVMVRSDVPRR
jgi:pyruvate/2-oxoglutarate/acetoin dehydrogenase E1 component